jgi:hypothetical protein
MTEISIISEIQRPLAVLLITTYIEITHRIDSKRPTDYFYTYLITD